jgi:hypothetical protein
VVIKAGEGDRSLAVTISGEEPLLDLSVAEAVSYAEGK